MTRANRADDPDTEAGRTGLPAPGTGPNPFVR